MSRARGAVAARVAGYRYRNRYRLMKKRTVNFDRRLRVGVGAPPREAVTLTERIHMHTREMHMPQRTGQGGTAQACALQLALHGGHGNTGCSLLIDGSIYFVCTFCLLCLYFRISTVSLTYQCISLLYHCISHCIRTYQIARIKLVIRCDTTQVLRDFCGVRITKRITCVSLCIKSYQEVSTTQTDTQ